MEFSLSKDIILRLTIFPDIFTRLFNCVFQIFINKVGIQHIGKQQSPTEDVRSAPRDFTIYVSSNNIFYRNCNVENIFVICHRVIKATGTLNWECLNMKINRMSYSNCLR